MSTQFNAEACRQQIHAGLRTGMEQALTIIQTTAAMTAPIDEGTLRGNTQITLHDTGHGFQGAVFYTLVYARPQHQHTEYVHPKGGKAHYLTDAVKDNEHNIQTIILNHLKAALH